MHLCNVICHLCLVVLCASSIAAADLPLGEVKQVGAQTVVAQFDVVADVRTDTMVGIYGPGALIKHPLTGEVHTEKPQLIAKALVLKVSNGEVNAKVTWLKKDAAIKQGNDVVPMPSEASPDSPPVLTGAIVPVRAEIQKTARIRIPVEDPEGGPLAIRWTLIGGSAGTQAGYNGRLWSQTTGGTTAFWTAPGKEMKAAIQADIYDAGGQHLRVTIPVEATALGERWRERTLSPIASFGDEEEFAPRFIHRTDGGTWMCIDDRTKKIMRVSSGWGSRKQFVVAEESGLRNPLVVATRGSSVYVLDGDQRTVLIVNEKGQLVRSFGAFAAPTDMVIAPDGTVYIADQRGGGIKVMEEDGRFRATLGFEGREGDGFVGLNRLAVDPQGILYALDAETRQIHRFNRFHRRLKTWRISGEGRLIDCAWHNNGLLVLNGDGSSLYLNGKTGSVAARVVSVTSTGMLDRIGEPSSITSDALGTILVTFPREQLTVRYTKKGAFAGMRGPLLWRYTQCVADAQGRLFGLDRSNSTIHMHDQEGWYVASFGGLERAGGPFQSTPTAIAVTPDGSALSAIDVRQYAVVRFNLNDLKASPIVFGQRGKNNGQFQRPSCLTMDEKGRTWVVDEKLHRVSVFDKEGRFEAQFGRFNRGRDADEMDEPSLIAISPDMKALYVYDDDKYEIIKFNITDLNDVVHVTNAGGKGKSQCQFYRPVSMGCDRQGLLYVCDTSRRDLQILDFRGGNAVSVRQLSTESLNMRDPDGITVSADGQVWLYGDERILGKKLK